ncbi:ATP-binding protein [Streptomyces bauhiniae]|uniref:ATP-binding protein n=1 Tax=Streptomyces bauhiniae TaxID=2340725 RepID=UPI0035E2AA76
MARRLVRAALAVWALNELAEDGVLVATELVSNAVRHARRASVRVVVERTAQGTVRIAVADLSCTQPVACLPGLNEDEGRGLLLVAALATRWGSDERRWGKIVWAELEARR